MRLRINLPLEVQKMKRLIQLFCLLLLVLAMILVLKTMGYVSKQESIDRVPQPAMTNEVLERLSESVQIQTVSYDDSSRFDPEIWDEFHAFLDSSYPGLNRILEKKIINHHSLLYHWKGIARKAQPAIFLAHMDVVPIEEATRSQWKKG